MEQEKRKAGRPTVGTAKKIRLNLTVSAEERDALEGISRKTGQSVSQLIGAWAIKENKRLAQKEARQAAQKDKSN